MNAVEYIGYRCTNLERMAARYGLSFHIDYGHVTTHSGYESESREATEEEQQMWDVIFGAKCDPEFLPATREEILSSLRYRQGPFTVSAIDLGMMCGACRDCVETCVDRPSVLQGLMAWFLRGEDRIAVYVSRAIPPGYFYEGVRIPEIHWRPDPADPKGTWPELSEEVQRKVRLGLHPFILRAD